MGLNTMTYWLTDRQSQCDFDFDLSLEYETVKYGHESRGTRTQELLRWRGPAAIVNGRPVLSSEIAPHINKPATDSNKNLVVSPRWVLDTKIDWPADRWS
jgi:hypothetical protein